MCEAQARARLSSERKAQGWACLQPDLHGALIAVGALGGHTDPGTAGSCSLFAAQPSAHCIVLMHGSRQAELSGLISVQPSDGPGPQRMGESERVEWA